MSTPDSATHTTHPIALPFPRPVAARTHLFLHRRLVMRGTYRNRFVKDALFYRLLANVNSVLNQRHELEAVRSLAYAHVFKLKNSVLRMRNRARIAQHPLTKELIVARIILERCEETCDGD